MDTTNAVLALAALAHATRLEVFRRLVRHEPQGLPAGDLARFAAIPHNTMSAHLAVLVRAGLASGRRCGRSIVYRADIARFRALVDVLSGDCCGGRPEACAPFSPHSTLEKTI